MRDITECAVVSWTADPENQRLVSSDVEDNLVACSSRSLLPSSTARKDPARPSFFLRPRSSWTGCARTEVPARSAHRSDPGPRQGWGPLNWTSTHIASGLVMMLFLVVLVLSLPSVSWPSIALRTSLVADVYLWRKGRRTSLSYLLGSPAINMRVLAQTLGTRRKSACSVCPTHVFGSQEKRSICENSGSRAL